MKVRGRVAHAVLAFVLGVVAGGAAFANPTGASVANGRVTFASPNPATLKITNTPGAIVNWRQFSIGAGETTRFIQNSAASAILNRVTGRDPSALLGRLLSNGRVFLINRNGIVFGPNAVIDTAGLVASTLNITDQDFIAKNLKFQGDDRSGSIENQGYIKAGADGNIFLIAPNITNSGIVETDGGQLVLAAGQSVTLASLDSDHIVFDIQAPEHEVVNLGELLTHGGAARMFAGTIRNSGSINADSVRVDSRGRVQLFATADVRIERGAVLNASGPAGGEVAVTAARGTAFVAGEIRAKASERRGGTVAIRGQRVALLDGAKVDASGERGGGEVRIGDGSRGIDPQGTGTHRIHVGQGAVIRADAEGRGDGGEITVWADQNTVFRGVLSARGGPRGGDGGFVEVSGRQSLEYAGLADLGAPHGDPGTLLLDPKNILVSGASGGPVNNLLFGNTPSGNVTISSASVATALASGNLILEANNDFQIAAVSGIGVSAGGSGGTLTVRAGRSVILNSGIITDNGDLNIFANNSGAVDAQRDSGAAQIVMAAGTTLNTGSGNLTLEIGAGPATFNSNGDIVLANINAADIQITNNGPSANSDILRTAIISATDPLITASSLFINHDPAGGAAGGSVGTAAAPLRISVSNLAAHTHAASPGIFFDSVNNGATTVGGTFFGGFHLIRGLETVSGGDIVVNSLGDITVLEDIALAGSSLTLNAGTDGIGDLAFDAEAAFVDPQSDGNISVTVGSAATNTGGATLSGENVKFLGASSNSAGSLIDLRLRGSGTLDINATGGDLIVRSGTGGTPGADTIKIISGDLTTTSGAGGAMNLTAFRDITVEGQAVSGQQLLATIQANNGKQTLTAGRNATVRAGPAAGSIVNVEANGSVVAGLQQELLLNQDATAGEGVLLMTAGGGAGNQAALATQTGDQRLDLAGVDSGITLQTDGSASTGTGGVGIGAAGDQTILVAGNGNVAVLADGVPVQISAFGMQTLTITQGGLNITATGNQPAIVSGQSQDIDAKFLQVISSNLAGGNATLSAAGGTQDVTTNNGLTNSILLRAGAGTTATLGSAVGNQLINTNGGLRVLGGVGSGGNASVQAQTGQTIGALFIDVIGAAGDAIIDTNGGLQDIDTTGKNIANANEGILVDATGAGAAAIHSDGTQNVAVVDADLVRVVGTMGSADITSAGTQSLALTGSGLNALEIGAAGAAGASLISGNQTITAGTGLETGSITVRAGNSGSGDATLSSIAAQTLSTTGNLTVRGGAAPGANATWTVPGDLSATIGGNATLTAGSGSNADVDLTAGSVSQFNVGGAMTIQAGTNTSADTDVISNGAFNIMTGADLDVTGTASDFSDARLTANGPFVITVGGNFNITGGNGEETDANVKSFSGGSLTANVTGALNMIANGGLNADVELEADQLLRVTTGAGLTIRGGGGSGAFSEIVSQNNTTDVTVTGNVNLIAGAGSSAEANIFGDAVMLQISAGDLNMTGGAGQDAETEIRSTTGALTITTTGNAILSGGTGNASVVNADDGTQAQIKAQTDLTLTTGGDLRLLAGTGLDADADIKTNTGTATVNVTGLVDVTGNGTQADAEITSETNMSLTTGGNLNLDSGAGSNSDSTVESKSGAMTANVGGALSMLPGNGSGADVEFEADTSFILNVGTTMTLDASSGGSNAFVFLGMTNADIAALPTSPLTITTGGTLLLQGGTQGGTAIDLQGGITTLNIGGNLDLIGGSGASTSVEIDQASIFNIDVAGALTLTGGSQVDTAALIGENAAGATVIIGRNARIGGVITLTGGTNAGGPAAIGTTCAIGPCAATVTVNGATNISLNSNAGRAFIGSLTVDPGDLEVKSANGNVALNDGELLTSGNVSLDAYTSSVVSQNASGRIRGNLLTVMADNGISLSSPLNDVAQFSGSVQSSGSLSFTNDAVANAGNGVTLTILDATTSNGTISFSNVGSIGLGSLNATPTGMVSVTASSGGARIFDTNGATSNVIANSATFNAPGGAGSSSDPLETSVNAFSLTATSGAIGLANTLPLSLASGDIAGIGSATFFLSAPAITQGSTLGFPSDGTLVVTGAGGLNLSQNVAATGTLRLNGGSGGLNVMGATVSGVDVDLSGGHVTFQALATTARATAINDLTVNTGGTLSVLGSNTTASAIAELDAGSGITINAGDVLVQGGSANFASASIDPLNVNVTLSGNLNIFGGSGNTSFGSIIATGGSVTITSNTALLPGNVTLAEGTGSNADGVIVAGQVAITASACNGCNVLGADPFLDPASQAGIFGGFSFVPVSSFSQSTIENFTNLFIVSPITTLEENRGNIAPFLGELLELLFGSGPGVSLECR